MSYRVLVLVKQVPDTSNISGDVMKPDGTVNRSKLPAVFNPEDKVALELALQLKDQYKAEISAITMGPPKASDILRECLYMGADQVFLVTDRKFAGADTLATSYVLSSAIMKLGPFDLVLAGRQAIDGDTAQVGPQTAEKLGWPQITYVNQIEKMDKNKITVRRKIDNGFERLTGTMPLLMTVVKEAAVPRPFRAKRVMAFKNAKTLSELEAMTAENSLLYADQLQTEFRDNGLYIETLTTDDLDVDIARCGLAGSPTKVHAIESVVLGGGDHIRVEASGEGLGRLVEQLMKDHIFG